MVKAEWRIKIKDACVAAGTYRPYFDLMIDELSQILEIRDAAQAQFVASGNTPVITHTNKAGHTNLVRNPALTALTEQNQLAIMYWRDLGLSPKGYKDVQDIVEVQKPVHEKKTLTIVGNSKWKKQA